MSDLFHSHQGAQNFVRNALNFNDDVDNVYLRGKLMWYSMLSLLPVVYFDFNLKEIHDFTGYNFRLLDGIYVICCLSVEPLSF